MADSMSGMKRSHRCAEVTAQMTGQTVTLMGWVNKRRNLGSLIFVDLRDRSGLIQLVFGIPSLPDVHMERRPAPQRSQMPPPDDHRVEFVPVRV